MTQDLIASAELLINRPGSEPTQADLNRAASTLYYALFHEISKTCADLFMGSIQEDYRRAWQQVYRALAHENTKTRCRDLEIMRKFPESIQEFATQFVTLQELRHQCDYDPLSKTPKTTVETELGNVRDVTQRFSATNELDLRAFCSFVLFPKREDPLRKRAEEEREQERARALRAEQEARGPAVRAERAARRASQNAQESS
ncbi:hypothetical protein D3273_10655 [Lichenibacterium minor]|uniref:Uncharacterized protein n=1 Tax=Lichenibacterium minor TaxID=2316528 RepID=A0A4Q2U5M6_9HYPH|nr:hypothetical protein [Lichenibacterium minor]RYC31889.1 hypothetical protein D3273_10655 [Lichenibacterium minor]